jgi:hypothetical protein
MSLMVNGWTLFPTPPDSNDGEDRTERLRDMLHDAQDIHHDHFERRIDAFSPARTPDNAVPVIVAEPAATPARSWPRTIAVSVVLLTVAAAGTMVTAIVNALINKSIKDKNGA